jgi:hypothetical protein
MLAKTGMSGVLVVMHAMYDALTLARPPGLGACAVALGPGLGARTNRIVQLANLGFIERSELELPSGLGACAFALGPGLGA